MSESARSVLKHLYKEGRMTEEQYQKIDRNLKEPQWIPCADRLPEKYGVYLVTNEEGSVFEYDYSDFTVHDGKWSFAGRNVIAWTPLPEPYKKEGDMDG